MVLGCTLFEGRLSQGKDGIKPVWYLAKNNTLLEAISNCILGKNIFPFY